jgi:hypothetical protein
VAKKPKPRKKKAASVDRDRSRCGLCGSTKNLTKTEFCGNWICDDEHTYVMFSYARNSCSRNHSRYTLCSFHHNEGHSSYCQKLWIGETTFAKNAPRRVRQESVLLKARRAAVQ